MSRALLAAGLATVAAALVACTSSGDGTGSISTPPSSPPPVTSPAPTPTPVTSAPTTPPPVATSAPATSKPPSSAPPKSTPHPRPPTSSAPPTSSPPSSSPPSGPPACTNADLDLEGLRGGALPGREIAGVIFTNSTSATCTLRGYPFAQLRRNDAPLGKPAKHHHGPVRTVTLKPGKSAQVQLTAVSTCQSPESDHVRIRVPGSPTATDVAMQLRGCSLSVNPIEPG